MTLRWSWVERVSLGASGAAAQAHVAGGHGDPLVAGGVEPGQSQGVLAVDVDVLAVRVPPPALVVAGAVRVADVPVAVHGGELHVVLVVEGVARVALEAAHSQYVAAVRITHAEVFVLSVPGAAVDVGHVDAHGGAVVGGELVHGLEAHPVLAGGVSEAVSVSLEVAVELDGSVVASLEEGGSVAAPGVERHAAGVDEVDAGRAAHGAAVAGQLAHQVLVLALHGLQLLHLAHQLRQCDDLSVVGGQRGGGGVGLAL